MGIRSTSLLKEITPIRGLIQRVRIIPPLMVMTSAIRRVTINLDSPSNHNVMGSPEDHGVNPISRGIRR
jgi:hypothetical protein